MKKIAYLLTLIMLLVPLAGCAGDDNDDNSPVGDWYKGESLAVVIYQNGTYGNVGPWNSHDDFGNWSTGWTSSDNEQWGVQSNTVMEGDILTIDFGVSSITGYPRSQMYRFAVDGDWLWMSELERNMGSSPQKDDDWGDCNPFAPEMIDEDEWDDRISELTPPSFCE
jgi:hypothetical protein